MLMFCLLKQCILWCLNSSGTLLKNIIVAVLKRHFPSFFFFFQEFCQFPIPKSEVTSNLVNPTTIYPSKFPTCIAWCQSHIYPKKKTSTTVIHVVCKLCGNYRDMPCFDASLMFCRERGVIEVETRGKRWDEIFGDDDNDFISTLNN